MKYFYVQHTLFAVSDKRKDIKSPYTVKKEAWNKPTKLSKGNQIYVIFIITTGKESMNNKMEKSDITMNITIMTLIQ